ncbi:40S ribosomal protein SA [Thamnidium elegans]|nr:40S ribosomal protein SA [Thamnidium elegans]
MDDINRFILDPTPEDILLLLAAKCHLGTTHVTPKMKKYVYTRRGDGTFIIDINKTWQKLVLAARVLASVKEGTDIYVTSTSVRGRRPASKLSMFLNTVVNLGRFSPGTLTKSTVEPRLLVCLDPYDDMQAITESSRCCIPVISFVNSDSSLEYVDIAIPCNTVGSQSIGVMCYLLARAVLRLGGKVNYDTQWQVIPDMFFHTDEVAQHEDDAPGEGDIPFAEDDGVNWEKDNPKPDWMTIPSTEPIDWAEDTPELNNETGEGWDTPASTNNNNQTWQGSSKSLWD